MYTLVTWCSSRSSKNGTRSRDFTKSHPPSEVFNLRSMFIMVTTISLTSLYLTQSYLLKCSPPGFLRSDLPSFCTRDFIDVIIVNIHTWGTFDLTNVYCPFQFVLWVKNYLFPPWLPSTRQIRRRNVLISQFRNFLLLVGGVLLGTLNI